MKNNIEKKIEEVKLDPTVKACIEGKIQGYVYYMGGIGKVLGLKYCIIDNSLFCPFRDPHNYINSTQIGRMYKCTKK
ncbi:MAG: hypothetical protein DRM99_04135 [Thermoplasmata archaeon]|nr:MAG: hypothetical protein DRM99_04135 [Thermoplasmata archaeon]